MEHLSKFQVLRHFRKNEQAQIRHKETLGESSIELDEMRELLEDLGEDF